MIFDYRKHRASHGLGNFLRVLNEITRGIEAPAKAPDYPALSPWANVLGAGTIGTGEGPGPARAPTNLGEGDRVKLVRPFWGIPDPDTGVLVRDRDAEDAGARPTYRAGSNGTIIYPYPAPEDFLAEMRAKSNYIVRMEDGRRLYSGNPSPAPWVNTDLERIPGQYQVTHHQGKTYVRPKFNSLDRVRLRESFICRNNGKRYEAGWRGRIFPVTTTLADCWATGLYEVSLDADTFGRDRGVVTVYAEALILLRDVKGVTNRPDRARHG
jgi:hypothetical protein